MKYYIIAGEASGDLHGAHLLEHLYQLDSSAEVRAWGGDGMKAAGADIVKHVRDLAFMGWWEVLMHLRTISANFVFCKKDVVQWDPDVIVMIDFPGFNLKLVQWFHDRGYRIIYYISPQVWAWKARRVEKIRKYVHRLLVILPFEEKFYADRGVEVDYVGHPLLDHIKGDQHTVKQENLIAVLPGSRKQEIANMLPVMLSLAEKHPELDFNIGRAPTIDQSLYDSFLQDNYSNVKMWPGSTYTLMEKASHAVVTSGTATLETALHSTPQVVCYKGSRISFEIAKRLVNVKFISLVNLILDREVVPELIQHQFTRHSLSEAFAKIRTEKETQKILKEYQELHSMLGDGQASRNAARRIIELSSEANVN